MNNYLTVYLKPTNYCTVGCEHCFLPEDVRANKFTTNRESLLTTLKNLKDICVKKQATPQIIWHGGEPLMLEPEYYEEASVMIDEVFGEGNYVLSLQTSLIPYSRKWNNLIINRFGGGLGTSIDFTTRKVRDSSDTYISLWLKRVATARKAGIGVFPIFVPSMSDVGRADEIYKFFKDNEFTRVALERYVQLYEREDPNYPPNKLHSEFLWGLFSNAVADFEERGTCINFKAVTAGFLGVTKNQSGDRWGTSCQSNNIVVEPDGSLNSCPDRSRHEAPFSNIDEGANAFLQSKARRKWIRDSTITHKESHCTTCKFSSWCGSGCPLTPNTPDDEFEGECSGFSRFLHKVDEWVQNNPETTEKLQELWGN
ncbi:SPASM domain-containing protein [Vibrio breoganii]